MTYVSVIRDCMCDSDSCVKRDVCKEKYYLRIGARDVRVPRGLSRFLPGASAASLEVYSKLSEIDAGFSEHGSVPGD